MEIRKASDRFQTRLDWLDSAHSFSFGPHRRADRDRWGPLRVLNDDVIAAGRGFGAHAHRDMEILTWVLEGALVHSDDQGGEARLEAGDLQRMRAGRGIVHAEWNGSDERPLHLLQIWLEPHTLGLAPGHREWRPAPLAEGLTVVASGRRPDAPLDLASDATVSQLRAAAGQTVDLPIDPGRRGYLHVASGSLVASDGEHERALGPGDALAWRAGPVRVRAGEETSALLFDLA